MAETVAPLFTDRTRRFTPWVDTDGQQINTPDVMAFGLRKDVTLITLRSNPELAADVLDILGRTTDRTANNFADGEIHIIPPEDGVRHKHVVIFGPTARSNGGSVNDSVLEVLGLIDACRRGSAASIELVMPYFAYARQDKKEHSGVPITASLLARIYEFAGADRIMTLDLHNKATEGSVMIPWDDLTAMPILAEAVNELGLKDIVVCAPDVGAYGRNSGFGQLVGATGIATMYKDRNYSTENQSVTLSIIGDVAGKNVVIVDDMADTCGTIVHATDLLYAQGARRIVAAVTHGLFSGEALQRLNKCDWLEEVITTDTVAPLPGVVNHPKIKRVSVAPLLAEAIARNLCGGRLSPLIPK